MNLFRFFIVSFFLVLSQTTYAQFIIDPHPPAQVGLTTPVLIKDNATSTTVDLFWTYTSGGTYTLQQDGVTIYTGTTPSFQATSLTQGVTYAFQVKVSKSGFSDSSYGTLSVTIPTFYNVAAYGAASGYSALGSRQTSLEPSNAGVDRAQSWSAWIKFANVAPGDVSAHVFNSSDNSGTNQQYSLFQISADNNTVSNKLRFIMFTNTSNLMYIQSASELTRNHWHHIVITYSGSEANTGLEMYINGVKETSPTRTTTGSYTGAYNSANLRFYVSNSISTRQFTGNIRDLALWDRALAQSDVDALYNAGVPVDVTGVSFYGADILAFYPLQANANCTNNATFNLTTTGTVSFSVSRAVRPITTPISFKRTTLGNTRYVAFGGAFRYSSDLVHMYMRSGTTHVLNGKIVKIPFTISTQTAGAPVDVITDATWDLRGGSAGIIGANVFKFSARDDGGVDAFTDAGRYVSTDGLTGESFGALQSMTVNYIRYNFYGETITENIGGQTITMVPFYGHNGAGTWKLSVYRSTDLGTTWTKIDIYDGALNLGESALVYKDGYWLMLIRRNDTPYKLYQSHSTDNGLTWTAPTATNLGASSGGSNASITINSVGMLQVCFMDRSGDFLYLSENNLIHDVIADPTDWNTAAPIWMSYSTDGLNILGYPNFIHLGNEQYWIGTSGEFSSSRADHFYAIGTINEAP